jgi:hypothetical protein
LGFERNRNDPRATTKRAGHPAQPPSPVVGPHCYFRHSPSGSSAPLLNDVSGHMGSSRPACRHAASHPKTRRASRAVRTEQLCGSTPAAWNTPLLRYGPVLPHMRHRTRRRGGAEPNQCAVHRRIGIDHFLCSGVDGPKPGSSAVLCIRNILKGPLKTCRYIAVGLGVLNLFKVVLHSEYPQGSGVREQNFSTAQCATLQSANFRGHVAVGQLRHGCHPVQGLRSGCCCSSNTSATDTLGCFTRRSSYPKGPASKTWRSSR